MLQQDVGELLKEDVGVLLKENVGKLLSENLDKPLSGDADEPMTEGVVLNSPSRDEPISEDGGEPLWMSFDSAFSLLLLLLFFTQSFVFFAFLVFFPSVLALVDVDLEQIFTCGASVTELLREIFDSGASNEYCISNFN